MNSTKIRKQLVTLMPMVLTFLHSPSQKMKMKSLTSTEMARHTRNILMIFLRICPKESSQRFLASTKILRNIKIQHRDIITNHYNLSTTIATKAKSCWTRTLTATASHQWTLINSNSVHSSRMLCSPTHRCNNLLWIPLQNSHHNLTSPSHNSNQLNQCSVKGFHHWPTFTETNPWSQLKPPTWDKTLRIAEPKTLTSLSQTTLDQIRAQAPPAPRTENWSARLRKSNQSKPVISAEQNHEDIKSSMLLNSIESTTTILSQHQL